jgi:effector-binding domain-containing protein
MISLTNRQLAGFVTIALYIFCGSNTAMAIEKAEYELLQKEGSFEIRQYDPQIVAETYVEGDFEKVGSDGFRRLFDFISGNNFKKQSISMTAPVTQEAGSEKIAMTAPVSQEKKGDQWRITFLIPAEYTLETLPKPQDERVMLVQQPSRLVAAVKYSGTWSRENYEQNKARLEEYIQANGLKQIGTEIWARYDPPFMPWFMRRNEVLMPVEAL